MLRAQLATLLTECTLLLPASDLATKFCAAIQCPNVILHMRGKSQESFGQEQRSTPQLNTFYFGARPMAILVSLPRLSLRDLGKRLTSNLLRKVYSAAQSFILNPLSDDNVARNICQQGIEWVENRGLLNYCSTI